MPVAITVVFETKSPRLSEDPPPEGRRGEEMCFSGTSTAANQGLIFGIAVRALTNCIFHQGQ